MSAIDFLPGVAADHVLGRLARAGGNEVGSGKLASPESSAALAVNTFGWFISRPESLPPFPGLEADFPPTLVDVEYCARFPWAGGRHPWLDAVVETREHLIGVESKRFEPYRDRKAVSFSAAYNRPVWGDSMFYYEIMRDCLRSGEQRFDYLDAAQLVKHAFGLVADGQRRGKAAVLLYLFAEPRSLHGRTLDQKRFAQHRVEIARFADAVGDSAVRFHAVSYRDWISTWSGHPQAVAEHGRAVLARFEP
jgi:hypothetical protein